MRTRLREYIDFGAVSPLPPDTHCPFGVQPLHVIIKPDKKPRLVIDLSRNLNDHLRYEYFSYSSVRDATELSTPSCWFSKLDLSNCFLSFPLHPSAQPHFVFRFDGRLYQFVRMPFGLASAPRVCTLLLSVVAHKLTLSGIQRLIRYLDDFLFIAHSREAMTAILHAAQQLFSDFGLVVNTDKTEGPAQQISFLGIQLDSVAQTLSCTATRLTEIRSLLRSALSSHKIRLSFLASLIGKLQFAATVLPGARPFVRRMLDLHQRHDTTTAFTTTLPGRSRLHRPQLTADCTSRCSAAAFRRTKASEPTLDSGSHTSTSGTVTPGGGQLRLRHSV